MNPFAHDRTPLDQALEWAEVVGIQMNSKLDPAIVAATDWVNLGRDVLVIGDDGSGKSIVLSKLAQESRDRKTNVLSLSGIRARTNDALAPFLSHELFQSERPQRIDQVGILRKFSEELRGRKNLMIIDDIECLDVASVALVERLLATTSTVLVASSGRMLTRAANMINFPALAILGSRAPAEVVIAPLGYWGIAGLISERLGGIPDAALIASIVTQSAGNPRTAGALLDAGQWSRALAVRNGLWTEVGSIEDSPHAAIVHSLTSRISLAAFEALELLSWTGSLRSADVTKLVDNQTLQDLSQLERIAWHRGRTADDYVSVSPPALSRGLRDRLTEPRRHMLRAHIQNVFGDEFVLPPEYTDDIVERLRSQQRSDVDGYWKWSAELTGLLNERVAVQQASKRATWHEDPSVDNACQYLETLLGRPAADQLEEIFHGTVLRESDSPDLRSQFKVYEFQWRIWSGQPNTQIEAFLTAARSDTGSHSEITDKLWAIACHINEKRPLTPELLKGIVFGSPGDFPLEWSTLLRASLSLEMGRPEEALEVIDGQPADHSRKQTAQALDSARSDALIMLGRLDDAARWSRRHLEQAYDQLDVNGIRVHALGLAQALFAQGNTATAWRAISTSLRLGNPGPFNFNYSRVLALGAVIQAHNGQTDVARTLLRDLEKYPALLRPVLGTPTNLAKAAIMHAEGDSVKADELLWASGTAAAVRGHFATAFTYWIAHHGRLQPSQAAYVQQALDKADSPHFATMLNIHIASAGGEEPAITNALRAADVPIPLGLAATAVNAINESRIRKGIAVLTMDERVMLVGEIGRKFTSDEFEVDFDGTLSEREQEVALLAQAGLSNREIAARLFLSVRTVENHMFRTLRKLGLGSRSELGAKWQPGG